MSLNLKIGRLGSAIDSATTGHFLSKGATDAVFQAVSSGGLDSASVTNLIDSAYIQARQTSGGSGGLDSAATISLINNNTNSGFFKYKYTATSGQTVFADSDANGNVMSFDPNSTLVFYNGVLLDETTDYTASSNTVTLTSGADAGVSITVAKYGVGYTPPEYPWGGGTAVLAGGYTTSNTRTSGMDYITIATPSNTSSFGNLTLARNSAAGVSNITRGVYVGGTTGSNTNVMDYITFASSSNATDFGDATTANALWMGVSDGTYGVMANGGTINQFTIATAANATAWTGTLTISRRAGASMNDTTRGVFAGGEGGFYNTIDYITIASDGNATDFGDMLSTRRERGGTSSKNGRGVMNGGTVDGPPYSSNEISYITIQTPSNATDFGDLTTARQTSSTADGTTAVVISSSSSSNVIDYYTVDTLSNATDFGDISSGNKSGIAIASGT